MKRPSKVSVNGHQGRHSIRAIVKHDVMEAKFWRKMRQKIAAILQRKH